jgi:hypothetical protein
VFIKSSSRLYKAVAKDSVKIDFIRIDSTLGLFYNIGSYQFVVGEDIYSYGGYGFWKNNGLLRKFNFKQSEWDIVPLEKEVIVQVYPVQVVWYNKLLNKLVVPLQQIRNDGIKNEEYEVWPVDEKAWELNLKTMDWTNVGKSSKSLMKFANEAMTRVCYTSNEGVLYVSYGLLYWFDYQSNNLYKCADLSLIQNIDRNEMRLMFSYMRGKEIFFWDPKRNIADTVSIANAPFEKVDQLINPLLDYKLKTALLILLLGSIFYFLISRINRKKAASQSLEKNNANAAAGASPIAEMEIEYSTVSIFNPTELELIKMFLELSSSGVFADIEQINHVLGIKNKNMGMQKKVRSDVMNSVNEKFKMAFGTDSVLITSIRKKEDKRFFDYYMVESNRHLVEKYLSQSQK